VVCEAAVRMEPTEAPYSDALMAESRRTKTNWILCVGELCFFGTACVAYLATYGIRTWQPHSDASSVYIVAMHAAISAAMIFVLVVTYLDTVPMTVIHRVRGSTSIPDVTHKFCHAGRWTTFTIWASTLGACYYVLATAAGAWLLLHPTAGGAAALPRPLGLALSVLWSVAYPASYLVNIVVSYLLVPAKKRIGDFNGLYNMLRWRAQALHNGFVFATTAEALLVVPALPLGNSPIIILFAIVYIAFSYALFAKTRVYHYFFFDPRWRHAPLAYLGLLGLLVLIFSTLSLTTGTGAGSPVVKGLLLLAACATCTFRDSAAVAPGSGGAAGVSA